MTSRASRTSRAWRAIPAILRHELLATFGTPIAAVFLAAFLFAAGAGPFLLASFFESGQASLDSFFLFHPWLHLFFGSALAMRLWAEERRSGTLELLFTLPIPPWTLTLGKFLAAWIFSLLALVLTFPIWLTVNYLGEPDNGVIIAAYVGSWLVAGAYLALGSLCSVFTRNQVIAFVLSLTAGFLFTMNGLPVLSALFENLPAAIADTIDTFSILSHFAAMRKGVLDASGLLFFASFIVCFLTATTLIAEWRRGQ